MAEAFARREIERRGWRHVRVASAGVAAHPGSVASEGATTVLGAMGIDLSHHSARLLDEALVDWADIVLAMGPSHLDYIDQLGGGHKAALLGDFAAGAEGAGGPIADPFGGGTERYRETARELEPLIRDSLDRLSAIVRP
jgi:protein arginine phosphatase